MKPSLMLEAIRKLKEMLDGATLKGTSLLGLPQLKLPLPGEVAPMTPRVLVYPTPRRHPRAKGRSRRNRRSRRSMTRSFVKRLRIGSRWSSAFVNAKRR